MNKFKLELTTSEGAVTVTQPTQENTLDLLNRLALEAGYNNIQTQAYVIEPWGDRTSTTTIFNRQEGEAYILNPAIAGTIKIYNVEQGVYEVPSGYIGPVGIHRALIGYGIASRINSVSDMKTALQPIINSGIMDLTNQFGNLFSGYRISMERPGYGEAYFREMENSPAYEIRLTLYKDN